MEGSGTVPLPCRAAHCLSASNLMVRAAGSVPFTRARTRIVPDEGEHRWAVSLGMFRSEEAAQAHLAALRAQGVRSARVGTRDTVVPRVWLQVKGVDAPLQARLKELARQIEGSELGNCP